MARSNSTIRVSVIGDATQLSKAFQQAERQAATFQQKMDRFGSTLTRNLTLPLAAAGAGAINAASDLAESMNAVEKIFGNATGAILEYGETASQQAGLSQRAFNESATVLGAALKNAGFSLDETADRTIELTQRAADMASVFNTSVPDALGAIQAALRGESDPIERYGVSLTAAAVNARALEMGLVNAAGEVTELGKKTAAIELIMEQTSSVAGDFADTSDGLANSGRVLKAEIENLAAALGESLLPMAEDAVTAARGLVERFNELDTETQKNIVKMGLLAAAIGPASKAIAALIGGVKTASAALGGLNVALGLMGISTWTGALKLAGAGALRFSGILTAVAGAVVSAKEAFKFGSLEVESMTEAYRRWTAEGGGAERVSSSLAGSLGDLASHFMDARSATVDSWEAGKQWGTTADKNAKRTNELAGKQGELEEATDATTEAYEFQSATLAGTVTPLQNAMRAAEDMAAAQEEIDRLIKEGKQDTPEYTQAVLDLAVASEEYLEAARDSASVAAGWEDSLRRTGTSAGLAADDIELLIRKIRELRNEGSTPVRISTPGGNSYFASGGSVKQGEAVVVGERGRELFIPNQPGQIVPNTDLRQGYSSGGSAGGSGMQVVVYVSGSVVTERDLATKVRDELVKLGKRNGTTGVS